MEHAGRPAQGKHCPAKTPRQPSRRSPSRTGSGTTNDTWPEIWVTGDWKVVQTEQARSGAFPGPEAGSLNWNGQQTPWFCLRQAARPAPRLVEEPAPSLVEEPAPSFVEEPAPSFVEGSRHAPRLQRASDAAGSGLQRIVPPVIAAGVPPPNASLYGRVRFSD